MPADSPVTIGAGALASADLLTIRNLLRWLGGFADGSKPFARVRSSTSVPLTEDADWTVLTFDTEQFNRGETLLFSSGDPTIFTIPQAGFYVVEACVRTDATTANKALRMRANGTTTIVQQDNIGVSTPAFTTMNVSCLYQFGEGDTVTAEVFQDSGGTIDAVVEGDTPFMSCYWYAIND